MSKDKSKKASMAKKIILLLFDLLIIINII